MVSKIVSGQYDFYMLIADKRTLPQSFCTVPLRPGRLETLARVLTKHYSEAKNFSGVHFAHL
jgi:hypothetical protein